jgi:hypothetical protein
MATVLAKKLKRQVEVDGVPYTVVIDPQGLKLVGKGRRKPTVQLAWKDLVSGEAALAVALRASVDDAGG